MPAGTEARPRSGFTLIEILVVVAIIALFVGIIGAALQRGGGATVGLQAAQTTVVGLLELARSHAALSGNNTALCIASSDTNPERYLRRVVVAENRGGTWVPVSEELTLPDGVYLLPQGGAGTAVVAGETWSVVSSVLSPSAVTIPALGGDSWKRIEFTSRGTPTSSGRLVLGTGRAEPPGSSPPLRFTGPDNIRGVQLSVYGQLTLLNRREDFP